jgi:hypothetical protein
MYYRATFDGSRDKWSISELTRWLGTTEKKLRSLIACLNSRNEIDVTVVNQTVYFNTVKV